MQVLTKKRGSQPWWVILLLIPLLVSCNSPVALALWKVTVYVGNRLAATATGQVIEKVIDTLIDELFHTTSPGQVIPDPNNPLRGTHSKPIKFTRNAGGKDKSYEIAKPIMVRDSELSPWHLAPDFEKEVVETFTIGY